MWPPDTKELVSIVSPLLTCVAAFFAWRAKKGVSEIHVMINSRMTDWMAAAEKAAHAAGVRSVLAEGVAKELLSTAHVEAAKLLVVAQTAKSDLINTAEVKAVELLATAEAVRADSDNEFI